MDRVLDAVTRGATEAEIGAAVARATRRSARHRHVFRLLTALLLVLAAGAAMYFYFLNQQLAASMARMQSVREAVQENRRLLGLTLDLETALRGYLLSGDDLHLQNYETADGAIPGQVALLERLLGDRPTLVAELAQIKQTLTAKREQLAAVQQSYQSGNPREMRRAYGRDLGERKTKTLRSSVSAIEIYLDSASLQERQIAAELMTRQFAAIAITLAAVSLIGLAAIVLGRRHFEAVRRHSEMSIALARSQRRSEDKTVFLAQVSHEIRTPMNAIFGFSGLLQDRLEDPNNRRYIDAITSSAHALLGVVNDLLDYSSIEAGKIGLTRRPCDLRDIVDAATSLLTPQASDKQLSLLTSMDENVPAALLMDGDRVRQMLLNLISNAVKYTERGSVSVRVSAEPGTSPQTATCTIEVIDTGPGIDDEHQARIFEPFARCGPPGSGGGTGLGLSITRQLARAMGGEVSLISRPGVGSRFRLLLPDLPIVAATEGPRASLRLSDLPPLRALAVDDIELNREVVTAMFAQSPHELRVAGSAREALGIIDDWLPDVMLLDIRMAEMDGIELAHLLRTRADTRRIRLIAVTATRLDTQGEDATLFDGIIIKPFTEQTVAVVIAQALEFRDSVVVADDAGSGGPPPSPQLADALRTLQPRWHSLCSTLTVSEVRSFAATLQELGQQHGSADIERYGRSLLTAAMAFDVAQMETLLAAFPERIAAAERGLHREAAAVQ